MDPYVTELPDSFEDSVDRMGKATLQSMEEVWQSEQVHQGYDTCVIMSRVRQRCLGCFRWRLAS